MHSHRDHILALTDICKGVETPVMLHMVSDGRDTDPHAGAGYLQDSMNHLAGTSITLASVVGRYYAMDRDQRRERTKIAYDLLVHGL